MKETKIKITRSIKIWDNEIPYFNSEFQNEHNENAPSIDAFIIDDGITRPCFAILPGGGYNHRSKHEGEDTARWLNSVGINAFIINYRVAPYVHPVELTDAKRAVRFIRHNAKTFDCFDNKLGLIGFSAGSHLAGCTAQHYDGFDLPPKDDVDRTSALPDMLCLCYPVVTLCEDYGHFGSRDYLIKDEPELILTLSLEKNVREDMPPVFMWHTFEDKSVSVVNSLELCKALKMKNVPFEYHVFPNGKHGLGIAKDVAGTDQWTRLFVDWLERYGFIAKDKDGSCK